MPSLLVAAVALTACQLDRTTPTEASTGPTPSMTATAAPSRNSPPAPPIFSSVSPPGEVTVAELADALARFQANPPVIHGRIETKARNGDNSRTEIWVDWPAFRFEETFTGENTAGGELVVATEDGKLFGYHDPLSDGTGVTRGFGEGAFVLGPVMQWFGEAGVGDCTENVTLDRDVILDRPAIRVGCEDGQGWDVWIDDATGLRLRSTVRRPDRIHEFLVGYVDLEFDPSIDPSLFDPRSI
jgi:hypothetical protein